jgi:SIR2-like domain
VLGPGVGGVAGHELATLLAERFDLGGGERGLAYVSQVVAARNGIGPLHDELHLALARDFEPSALHAWLAGLPSLLRRRALPQQLIVSTCFDSGVECAFEMAGEELDVVVYVAAGRDRGKFLHIQPDGRAVVVEEPNAYHGLSLEERSVLFKIHGHVDRGATRELESFAVSEDDHIDYLAGVEAAGTVPVQLAARLRRSHLLFLGYAVDDWSLRVFLRRVWGHDRLAYRSWAVQPSAEALARELWRERGVEAYDVGLDGYSEQLARVTAELAGLDAAV